MIKIVKSFFVVFAVITIAVLTTGAFLSDSETSSGNSFTAGTWTPGPAKIVEVYYDPVEPGSDSGLEFIKIKNVGTYYINLNNYLLHHSESGSNDYIFGNVNLAPGAIITVDSFVDNMNDIHGSVSLFKNATKNVANILDFVRYGYLAGAENMESNAVIAGIWTLGDFVPDVATGHSIKLSGNDNNVSSDWIENITPGL